ncbi:MAG: sugar-phosphate kinase, partial [Clostridia bacterium]|nr:sugar-phosphate kinase [Clostridia bacterium]
MKNNLTMTEMFRGNMILKQGGDPATLMGTGPMSYECIKAQLLNAMERDYPVYFIASRNQVD